jgi:hypothetical protein
MYGSFVVPDPETVIVVTAPLGAVAVLVPMVAATVALAESVKVIVSDTVSPTYQPESVCAVVVKSVSL